VSRRRTTFGKLQRDRDKQAKQRAKREKRAERAEQSAEDPDEAPAAPEVDQATVLARLAQLHADFDDDKISFEEFEEQRDELTSQLHIE
jgi:sRNA-binding protein